MRTLKGRVALITGSSRGLGAAVAKEAARAGASIALLGRDSTALDAVRNLVADVGRPVIALACDLVDAAATEAAVATAADELGPIDLLINNAGAVTPIGRLPNLDSQAWRRTVDVNLGAAFTTSLAVLPGMMQRGAGWIVNVSSGAAAGPGMPYGSAYSVSKAALEALTRHMAAELEGSGIRINAIRPGRVDTSMQDLLRDETVVGESLARKHQGWQASGELLPPAVPARLVLALCCAERSGQVISVYDDEGRRLIAETDRWFRDAPQ